MNSAAALAFGAALALAAALALMWLARQPMFAIHSIRVQGQSSHNSEAAVRANVLPHLEGGFFFADLQALRAALQTLPWVRQAVVRRLWPDALEIRVQEHQPAAVWKGQEGDDRLVNSYGEVFEANLGDVDDSALPNFEGDEADAPRMLAMYRRLKPALAPLDVEPAALTLSGRGTWVAELDDGAELVLGRGSDDEVLARVARYVRTVAQIVRDGQTQVLRADLRHADGYAVRLKTSAADGRQSSGQNGGQNGGQQ